MTVPQRGTGHVQIHCSSESSPSFGKRSNGGGSDERLSESVLLAEEESFLELSKALAGCFWEDGLLVGSEDWEAVGLIADLCLETGLVVGGSAEGQLGS